MKIKHLLLVFLFVAASCKMRSHFGDQVSFESCLTITLATLVATGIVIKYMIQAFDWFIRHFINIK